MDSWATSLNLGLQWRAIPFPRGRLRVSAALQALGFCQRFGRRWGTVLAPELFQFTAADVIDLERSREDLRVVVGDADKGFAIAAHDRLGRGDHKDAVLSRDALCRGALRRTHGDRAPWLYCDDVPITVLRITVDLHHRLVMRLEFTEEGQERPVGVNELETADGGKQRGRLGRRAWQDGCGALHRPRDEERLRYVANDRVTIPNGFEPNDVGLECRSRPLDEHIGSLVREPRARQDFEEAMGVDEIGSTGW